MPYRFESEGVADIMKQVRALEERSYMIASASLYEGAAVMAKAINDSANKIKTAPFKYAKPGEKRLPSPEEKQMVTEAGAMGIAKFRKNLGAVDTSVGYNSAGYAAVKWNHMSSKARTNYKHATFKGREINASSTLKWIRDQGGSEKYGISANIGKGAQNMKPIGVVANSINSGTSFMDKQPFMRNALRAATPKCEAAIIAKAESLIESILKENEQASGGKTA
jgi:hypothetical protein